MKIHVSSARKVSLKGFWTEWEEVEGWLSLVQFSFAFFILDLSDASRVFCSLFVRSCGRTTGEEVYRCQRTAARTPYRNVRRGCKAHKSSLIALWLRPFQTDIQTSNRCSRKPTRSKRKQWRIHGKWYLFLFHLESDVIVCILLVPASFVSSSAWLFPQLAPSSFLNIASFEDTTILSQRLSPEILTFTLWTMPQEHTARPRNTPNIYKVLSSLGEQDRRDHGKGVHETAYLVVQRSRSIMMCHSLKIYRRISFIWKNLTPIGISIRPSDLLFKSPTGVLSRT